jgi:hypothetical protein
MHPSRRPPDQPSVNPLRWLVNLGPLKSWLVVMAIIIGLNLLGLRLLAWVVALTWLAYAAYTWIAPHIRRSPGHGR